MAANSFRPPKPWTLTEDESVTSYASWHSNSLYHLSLICNEFAPFLASEWSAKSLANHGLEDDGPTVDAATRKSAVQKSIILERM